MGSAKPPTMPAMTMMMDSTPAKTGRSMKNLANMSATQRGGGGCGAFAWLLDYHWRAGFELHQVVDDDSVTRPQAITDDPIRSRPAAGLDRALRCLAGI